MKYSNVKVELSGQDENVFAVFSRVIKALKSNGVDKDEIEEFINECKTKDYDGVLTHIMNNMQFT